MKRKVDNTDDDNAVACKKQRLLNPSTTPSDGFPPSLHPPPQNLQANQPADETSPVTRMKKPPSRRIRKLVPPRPWTFNPAADNATGPRSAKEGRNYICLTRKTALGAYMRRCKGLFLDDGYTSIHLSAMGAAIPHLMQLACIFPDTLPFPDNEIHMDVTTGTVEVQDEVLPEEIDEDVVYDTRYKSTLKVTFRVGNGENLAKKQHSRCGSTGRAHIMEEPEQQLPDMV
ncbi:hypothetical protein AX15_004981 [Amanita polypyramis BW_CC]|nr:hypothetical protein AX15_004981 [Amanita polypyramis BW_CC]